jgi:hypothetical protein
MLKLIYSLSDKEITLKFNKKSLFWTKEIVIALSISLAFHLVPYFAFQIKSLEPLSERILLPGFVTTEISKKGQVLKREKIDEYGFIQNVPIPPKSLPILTSAFAYTESPLMTHEDKKVENSYDSFNQIEKIREPIISPLLNHYRLVKPIQIQVFGPLSQRCLGLKMKPKKVLLGSTETLFVKFRVTVEDKTGCIFHSEIKESSGNAKYDQYALNILKNIEFEKRPNQFATSGEIEFLIEADKRDLYD